MVSDVWCFDFIIFYCTVFLKQYAFIKTYLKFEFQCFADWKNVIWCPVVLFSGGNKPHTRGTKFYLMVCCVTNHFPPHLMVESKDLCMSSKCSTTKLKSQAFNLFKNFVIRSCLIAQDDPKLLTSASQVLLLQVRVSTPCYVFDIQYVKCSWTFLTYNIFNLRSIYQDITPS